ncbi:MAG: hypothetical protein JSU65_01780 [Candidatus Zixiibacteriota bacterium]|nr:MAG: hypothetical protein JSU65_01780 [candidate division Zixibacteria bacterium]
MKQTSTMIGTNPRAMLNRPDGVRGALDSNRLALLGETSHAGIQSILLGLRLRGWLTESENNLLGLLTCDGSTSFLYYDGKYLQPSGANRFSMEPIKTALSTGSAAIFSHREKSGNLPGGDPFRIHAAIIDPEMVKPIVLGLATPEIGRGAWPSSSAFDELLRKFREASAVVESVLPKLAAALEQPVASLLINRTSGRIVVANKPFCSIIRKDSEALVDREFGQAKQDLLSVLPGLSLEMKNLTRESLCLTLVRLRAGRRKDQRRQDPFMVDFFTHKMRNKISAITTAASHLEAITSDEATSDLSELVRIILRAASETDHYLSRWNLIVNYGLLKPERISVDGELDGAVRAVSATINNNCRIAEIPTISAWLSDKPAHALMYLFEACLQSHLAKRTLESRTRILWDRRDIDGELIIRIETQLHQNDSRDRLNVNWKDFASRLADVMNLKLTQQFLPDQQKLLSEITLHESQGHHQHDAQD